MKKRLAALLGFLTILVLGAVARAVELPEPYPQLFLFTRNGEKLIVLYDEFHQNQRVNVLQTWEIASGRLLAQVVQPEPATSHRSYATFSPDRKLFCYVKEDGKSRTLIVAQTATGAWVSTLETPSQTVTPQAFSADGKLVAGKIQETGAIRIWEVATGKPSTLLDKDPSIRESMNAAAPGTRARENTPEEFHDIQFSNDNRFIIRTGWSGMLSSRQGRCVVVSDRHTGQRLNAFLMEASYGWHELLISPDGRYIVDYSYTVTPDAKVPLPASIWNTLDGKLVHTMPFPPRTLGPRKVLFSEDENHLTAMTFSTSQQRLGYRKLSWSNTTWQLVRDVESPVVPIANPYGLLLPTTTPDGRLMARRTQRNVIEVLEVESGKVVREIGMEVRF